MKIMGKIITGVLIVSVIFIYIKKHKEAAYINTKEIAIQTEEIDKSYDIITEQLIEEEQELPEERSTEMIDGIPESSKETNTEMIYENSDLPGVLNTEMIDEEYIQNEDSDITQVENLTSPSSEADSLLKSMNLIELKELAKEQDIKGISRMKKAELIKILSS